MKRSEIETKYTWNTDEILSGKEEFVKRVKALDKQIDFSKFKGTLKDEFTIKACFDKLYDLAAELEVLSVYAMLKRDEDGTNSLGNELSCLIEEVSVKFSSEVSFVEPELSTLGAEKLTLLSNSELLKDYDLDIKRVIDFLPHLLSEETEKVLSLGGKVYGGYDDAFSMLDNVDLDFPTVKVDGKKVETSLKLEAGQEIRIPPLDDKPKEKDFVSDKNAELIQSLVIYKDNNIIALNKPSGMAVQGGTNTFYHLIQT